MPVLIDLHVCHFPKVFLEAAFTETVVFSQSAAALCVAVGSFSDPEDLPGLAHFLEHSTYLPLFHLPQLQCKVRDI